MMFIGPFPVIVYLGYEKVNGGTFSHLFELVNWQKSVSMAGRVMSDGDEISTQSFGLELGNLNICQMINGLLLLTFIPLLYHSNLSRWPGEAFHKKTKSLSGSRSFPGLHVSLFIHTVTDSSSWIISFFVRKVRVILIRSQKRSPIFPLFTSYPLSVYRIFIKLFHGFMNRNGKAFPRSAPEKNKTANKSDSNEIFCKCLSLHEKKYAEVERCPKERLTGSYGHVHTRACVGFGK